MDDWQLLQDYATRGSEAAFRALVERHLGLVFAAAQRQVGNPHLAEEVAQAVFILLARKARGFRPDVVLPGWLFRTTRFVAARALRSERRRRQREQEALHMQECHTPDAAAPHLAPLLDEALAQLGAKERDAVLLRFAQERSLRDVGAQLGVSEEAAKKRVARALERLRGFFLRRGFALSATVLAGTLARELVAAAPDGLAGRVTVAATAKVGAGGTAATALARETLDAWTWARLKLAGAWLAVGVTTATLAFLLIPSRPRPPADRAPRAAIEPTATSTPASTAAFGMAPGPLAPARTPSAVRPGERVLHLFVVDRATGDVVPRASLAVNVVAQGDWRPRFDLATDERGWAEIPYAAEAGRVDVGILSPGWAARFATWMPSREDPVPDAYTLRVDRVTDFVGGWLQDESGHAVTDAAIWGHLGRTGDSANRETPRERFGFVTDVPLARSGADGLWTCAVIPRTTHRGFQLEARHPAYRVTSIASSGPASGDAATGPGEAQPRLWAAQSITRMDPGVTLSGRVLEGAGRPVAGADVAHAPHANTALRVTSDADGRFVFSRLEAAEFDLAVTATGFAPAYWKGTPAAGMAPLEILLKPGARLRLHTVDESGLDVPGVTVGLEQWGEHRHKIVWSAETGPDGRLEWNSAPTEGELDLYATRDGWCYTRDVRVTANGEEHRIAMRRALTVEGRAIDAETGLPLPECKAFPGYGTGEFCWERLDTRRGADGAFRVVFQENRLPWRVRVEAEGYAAFVSEPLAPGGVVPLEVALKRLDPEQAVRGVVWRPDGQPAAGAEVALLTFEHNVQLAQTRFRREPNDPLIVTADAAGRFAFPPDPLAHTVVAVGDAGFARLRLRGPKSPLTVRLQPWGTIEGVIDPSARTKPVKDVMLEDAAAPNYAGHLSLGYRQVAAGSESGRFRFEFVPPEPLCLWLNPGIGAPFHHRTPVSVRAGEPTPVAIAETGLRVRGRFLRGGEAVDGSKDGAFADLSPVGGPAQPPAGLTGDAARLWAVDYWTSEEGRRVAAHYRSTRLQLAADGRFESEDALEPGAYRLRAMFGGPMIERLIAVPAPDSATGGFFDVGSIPLDPAPSAP